jgi:transposase
MSKKNVSMEIINPHAAGIDVGSRSHYVAVGQGMDELKEFGVYAPDLLEIVEYLKANEIATVAMESTGTYWQSLFVAIQGAGIDAILVNGKFTKNIKGKKTDVQDCQWIQKLHSLGLLSGSFLPDDFTEQLRTYCRHRSSLLEIAADTTKKMQKYLRLLNLRLDVVLKDITGESGMKIIEAVIGGETNPVTLASLANYRVKKSRDEIAKALQSNQRADYLFALKHEYEMYHGYQQKIKECDIEIDHMLQHHISKDKDKNQHTLDKKLYKKQNKNTPKNIDINLLSYQYFGGVDLLAIEGVSHSTVLTLISEVGEGIHKFESAKHFASWLRLCPNNKVSGGRMLSHKIPKGSNRLKIALRNAANAIGNLRDTSLSNFFNRISARKGRTSAISATARKLAVIIWNMIVKKQSYVPSSVYTYDQQKSRAMRRMQKLIRKFDFKPNDLGLIPIQI